MKKTLLDLLLEDKEFRHAVAGAIGYKEILDRFAKVEEEIRDLRKDMDTRFLKLEERIAENQARNEERFLKLEERIVKVEEDMNARFLKVEEEIKSLREEAINLRKETNNLRKDMNNLRRDMQEGFKRLDLKVSALGARWGIMNEQSVRDALKGIVGKELGYRVEEWNTYDDEGYVYGYPSNVQLDIVVSNGKIIAVEVASHVKRSDPLILKKKVELYRKREGRDVSRVMFVTPFIDDDAIDACNRFGIEVYST
ncbi:MAG: DUF3782 domain-containing protein [Desulfurococcaceae archaeon]